MARRRARAGGGRQVEVTIDELGGQGDGIARWQGRPLFVPLTLPGDRLRVRLTGERAGAWVGEAVELIAEGPGRVAPPCPHFGPCGGCSLQHLEAARRISLQIARRCPSWISVDDLLAAGMLGLTEAAQRFDPTRGQPFLAFASRWIRGATIDELRRGDFMPRRLRAKAKQVGRTIRELEHKLGRDPEDEEIAAELGVPVEEFRTELATLVHANVFSLDESASS